MIQTISYIPHFFLDRFRRDVDFVAFNKWLYQQVMMSLGLMNQGVNHLLDPDKYWWIAVLSDLWKEVGWGTILYLAGMSRIDPTFYEAARIDGASKLTQIRTITLPY